MLVFDTEGDGLIATDDQSKLMTKLHNINLIDRATGERLRYNNEPLVVRVPPNGTLEEGARLLMEADAIAGHNIIGHDIPAIRFVFPWFEPKGAVIDTLIYSRLIWTNIRDIDLRAIKRRRRPAEWEKGCKFNGKPGSCTGKHSLASWGFRLGDYKGDFDGPWDVFTADMDDYCMQDVEVTLTLLEKIEAEGYSQWSLELETKVARIIDQQEKHGVLFNVAAAEKLAFDIQMVIVDLEDRLRAVIKPWFVPERANGELNIMTPKRSMRRKKVFDDGTQVIETITEGAPYCKVKLVNFEPGSRDKIADRLTKLFGWKPQEFTETGKPKIDETTLDALEYPEAGLIKDYLKAAKAYGFLAGGDNALLKKVQPDGRIHGRVNTNGAVTGRMTHSTPNLAQVAKVKVDKDGNILMGLAGGWGYELRSLFIVPKGKKLVGVDAEGLELRMLAHYMARYDGGAYAVAVVDGKKSLGTDAHSLNRDAIGMVSRDSGKTWIYAYLYGAGNWKLGFIFYEDMPDDQRAALNRKYQTADDKEAELSRVGGRGRKRIETRIPALGALVEKVKEVAKAEGHLRSLDGRKIHVRGLHSALNSLLQGGGAIVMKLALVLAYEEFLSKGWQFGREFAFVLNVHDEFQIEAMEEHAEEIGQIAADAIRRAGEEFKLRVPLAGSQDIGDTWADTH